MINWFKKKQTKISNIEKMFDYPAGIFLYIKDKYQKEFIAKINSSKVEQIYQPRIFESSLEEISKYSDINKCDYSGEPFETGERITKYWIVNK